MFKYPTEFLALLKNITGVNDVQHFSLYFNRADKIYSGPYVPFPQLLIPLKMAENLPKIFSPNIYIKNKPQTNLKAFKSTESYWLLISGWVMDPRGFHKEKKEKTTQNIVITGRVS